MLDISKFLVPKSVPEDYCWEETDTSFVFRLSSLSELPTGARGAGCSCFSSLDTGGGGRPPLPGPAVAPQVPVGPAPRPVRMADPDPLTDDRPAERMRTVNQLNWKMSNKMTRHIMQGGQPCQPGQQSFPNNPNWAKYVYRSVMKSHCIHVH